MEILYVIGMIAVFVLCLALLSTARRILRSSPLSSGQFGASRMYDVEPTEDEASTETSSARMILSRIEGRGAESNADPVEPEMAPASWYERAMAAAEEAPASFMETKPEMTPASWYETMMAAKAPATHEETNIGDETVIDKTIGDEATVAVSLPSMASELTENLPATHPEPDPNPYMDDFEPPQENRWARLRKPSRQKYNYALECLLLGVSAWVLIRTQRSALRLRAPQSSDRVA